MSSTWQCDCFCDVRHLSQSLSSPHSATHPHKEKPFSHFVFSSALFAVVSEPLLHLTRSHTTAATLSSHSFLTRPHAKCVCGVAYEAHFYSSLSLFLFTLFVTCNGNALLLSSKAQKGIGFWRPKREVQEEVHASLFILKKKETLVSSV